MSSIPAGELNGYVYTACYDQLLQKLSERIKKKITKITHQNQISIQVDEGAIYYSFHIFACYDVEATEAADDLCLTCRIDIYSNTIDLIDVFDMKTLPYRQPDDYGVKAKQDLIPNLYEEKQKEKEAERFLTRYYPQALSSPMPVPIRRIMEEQMGLSVVSDVQLLDDAYGQTMFSSDDMLVINLEGSDIEVVRYERGTVFIDGFKAFQRGTGAMNFTLAHEAYHWFAHRPYVDLHRLVGKPSDKRYDGVSRY